MVTNRLYGPRHEKTGFLHMRKQRRRSRKLISAFVFTTRIVQFLFYLNPKFQASNHLLWLYSSIRVGPGRNPRRPVFSQRGSYSLMTLKLLTGHKTLTQQPLHQDLVAGFEVFFLPLLEGALFREFFVVKAKH